MNDIPKYEIFDDILTKEEQEILIDIFFDRYFPFYFSENIIDQKTVVQSDYYKWSDDNTVDDKLMVHMFIGDDGTSYTYPKIEHILQKFYEKTNIKFYGIHRCKLNLQYQVADYNQNNYQCPHVDQRFDHKVLIYYPYTSDGDIFLFNEIEPKKYDTLWRCWIVCESNRNM